MPMWPIRNVMTTDVITAADDTPIAEIAAILADQGIGAVPIVDQFDVVVGVVSWTDLHRAIDPAERDDRRDRPAEARWPDRLAVHVMSAPPVTVGPDESLHAAGRLMQQHNIGRLPVTDAQRRLLGIVTRRDLLKAQAWAGRRQDDTDRPTGAGTSGFVGDIVDEWGRQSFPASDPPMNW